MAFKKPGWDSYATGLGEPSAARFLWDSGRFLLVDVTTPVESGLNPVGFQRCLSLSLATS